MTADAAALAGESVLVIEAEGRTIEAKIPATGSYDQFAEVPLGTFEFQEAGEPVIKARPRDAQSWKPINLRTLTLKPASP